VAANGIRVCQLWNGFENFEFIRRAANNHDTLLEVLRKVARAANATDDYIGKDGQLIKEVRAAIANAA
jgi:hypothetical protein